MVQSLRFADIPIIADRAGGPIKTAPGEPPSPEEHLLGVLQSRGQLREGDLARIARLRQGTDTALCSLLIRLGLIGECALAETLSDAFSLMLLAATDFPEKAVLPERISPRFLKMHQCVPVAVSADDLTLAMGDPLDTFAIEAIALAARRPVNVVVSAPSDIDTALERLYGRGRSAMGRIADAIESGEEVPEEDVERLKDIASEAPIIRLVNLIFHGAVDAGVSDIHIEPFEHSLKIRYRIDGFLRVIEAPPIQSAAAVISRIKLLARLDIAEHRLPQDGRLQLRIQGKEIDVRVSTVPTLHGESIVLRLLETGREASDFSALGFAPATIERLMACLGRPQGILLVTGPTGSGKTTTLYTALGMLNTAERKIITVEDPIEYKLDGMSQIQVKPQIGLGFANALRSILRQDPDVIMIGEMRDTDTARISVQAALTGHLVLSTLHTNDAPGALTRLLDMGVEDYLLTSTVSAILAQRLVRRLCPWCRTSCRLSADIEMLLREEGFIGLKECTFYEAKGCERCANTGYEGRMVIHELLHVYDAVRQMIMSRADAGDIRRAMCRDGMHTMRQDGFAKAAAGLTTIEEILRVTQELH
ncbi:MAG: ATPase, T2SS/T4P/T4SS family [Haliea sp.]